MTSENTRTKSERMRKLGIPALAITTALLLVAPILLTEAFAASPKFTRGSGIASTSVNCFIDADFDLNCTGEISGLGGSPTGHLQATVAADFDCFNPAGKGPNKGHSAATTVSGPGESLSVVNGKATFSLEIKAPTGPDAPNDDWDCHISSITYSNVVVVVDTVSGQFTLPKTGSLGTFTATA